MKSEKTKLAILGGKGMLGSDLAAAASASGRYSVTVYDLPEFDITRASDLEKAVKENDVIVNCAAYTAVDRAETEKEKCSEINALAPGLLGKLAAAAGRRVLHVGTDFVFGDTTELPMDESVSPSPLNFYGKSKLHGEQSLASSGCRHAIIRIEWTYGRHGGNFISKIKELAGKNKSLKVVGDQFGSPSSTVDVSRAMLCLLGKNAEGLYHFAADGFASRAGVAQFIVGCLGLKTEIIPCGSSEFPSPARRPLNSRFDCSKIDSLLDFKRPHWKQSLEKFLTDTRQ